MRRTPFITLLLLAALTAIVAAPTAKAEDPVAEVAATVGTAAEQVTTTAPPPSAPTPPSPTTAPSPAPTPPPAPDSSVATAATDAAASTVENALGPSPGGGGAASKVVRKTAERSAETVNAVTETSGAGKVPIVDAAVRGVNATADSLVNTATKAAKTEASAHPSPGPQTGEKTAVERTEGSAPLDGRIGPPSPAPSPTDPLALSVPRGEAPLVVADNTSANTLGAGTVDAHARTSLLRSVLPSAGVEPTPAGSPTDVPSLPPSPIGAAASSSPGGGFGSSFLLLGLLALFAWAAPRTPPRFVATAAGYRPASVVCALERPG